MLNAKLVRDIRSGVTMRRAGVRSADLRGADLNRVDLRGDDAFGLVEILISMFLLTVISLFMLPVFVSTLQLSSRNVSLTTATQLVSEEMDVARQLATSCVALQGYAAETTGLFVPDPTQRILVIHREAPVSCPVSYPAGLSFKVWITLQDDATNTPIASAETRIYISSENGAP
jgi:type II secretory pathway pseudopilin PulG